MDGYNSEITHVCGVLIHKVNLYHYSWTLCISDFVTFYEAWTIPTLGIELDWSGSTLH